MVVAAVGSLLHAGNPTIAARCIIASNFGTFDDINSLSLISPYIRVTLGSDKKYNIGDIPKDKLSIMVTLHLNLLRSSGTKSEPISVSYTHLTLPTKA